MRADDAATYERARRLANVAMWTVALQRRRLNSTEPEDKEFVFRTWADFQFLIVALNRLRRAAGLAAKVPALRSSVGVALSDFDADLPWLNTLRNVAEHIDDYSMERGRDRNIDRRALEVSTTDGETWTWLDCEVNVNKPLKPVRACLKQSRRVEGS